MTKYTAILFAPLLLLAGCGVKGPLTLPPNPEDSYLSRIEKSINEMTDSDEAAQAPEGSETKFEIEPASGSEEVKESKSPKSKPQPPNLDRFNGLHIAPPRVGSD